MKAYQTDDGEIRFYFDKQDIAVHNLEFSDLIVSSAKSRELLALLLRYAHERFGFNPKGNHLTIGAIPLGTDHFLLTLSDKDATRFPGLSQAAERDDESDEAGASELYDDDDSLLPEDAKEVSSEDLLGSLGYADSDAQDDFWNNLANGAKIRDDSAQDSAQGEVIDAGADATASDTTGEANDDSSEEGFRSFLQYMMGFLSDDHDQAPTSAGNTWQGAGNDPEAEAVN
ncbi:MAG: adaptor protein MecA, partial [Lachnospiraceae bacterium]|nr:adaptor protein MecA [Lachnospiraceae bacterium]